MTVLKNRCQENIRRYKSLKWQLMIEWIAAYSPAESGRAYPPAGRERRGLFYFQPAWHPQQFCHVEVSDGEGRSCDCDCLGLQQVHQLGRIIRLPQPVSSVTTRKVRSTRSI